MAVVKIKRSLKDTVAASRRFLKRHRKSRYLLTLLAVAVLILPISAYAQSTGGKFAGGVFVDALCDIFDLMQGDLGGLLAAAAGLAAVLGGAFGSLKGAPAFIVVAGGAFTISTGVSLYFGTFECTSGTAGISSPAKVSAAYNPNLAPKIDFAADPSASVSNSDSGSADASSESASGEEVEAEDEKFSSDPFDKF